MKEEVVKKILESNRIMNETQFILCLNKIKLDPEDLIIKLTRKKSIMKD
ncbi:hypothetical protein MOD25_05620 [Bacillus haynesii]|nr:hypothetical protein [Bacillus haynesii]MCY8549380.1 hypothetical protein [Bacillus haynesii]